MKTDYEYRPRDEYSFMTDYPEDRPRKRREAPEFKERDCECCFFPKHPRPKKILLECGCHPEDAIFEIDYGKVEERQSFILDRVVVDTTCLCKPLVKIEFSSLVFFEAEAKNCGDKELEVDLLFELIKICDGKEEIVQKWRYLKEFEVEHDDKLEVEISEPFTVTFCDRECPGCCTYKMKVTGKDFEGEFKALRVVKPDLSALAQDLIRDCN